MIRRVFLRALRQTGYQQEPHFSALHQVLNRARWAPLEASRHLLTLILQTFVQAGGMLDVVIDERFEWCCGAQQIALYELFLNSGRRVWHTHGQ